MQQGTTILQYLAFPPHVSFNDPATPDGKTWNSALKSITLSRGWSQLHWGTRLMFGEIVDLLITWKSHADLEHFMAHNYRPFLTAISPLNGADSSPLIPLSYPYIMQLHPGMPSLELGAVSALYELSFNAGHDADVKTELAIETQLCRNLLLDAAQEVGDGDRFLGMDAVWVERYGPPPPSSSSPTATDSAFSKRADEREQILLVITEWTNQHVEKTMLDSGRIEESRGGQALTIGEYFAKNILQRACTYTKHDVVFENVLPSNSQWLDKGEKWSTYVARLLAEGEQRRGDEGAAEPRI